MKHWQHNISRAFVGTEDSPRVYSKRNVEKLKRLVETSPDTNKRSGNSQISQMIDNGRIVDPKSLPCDVVTLNSEVMLGGPWSRTSMAITLVYPNGIESQDNRISVLTPLGSAILGRRVRDEVEYITQSGIKRVRIERILYQPEAMGHY